jgi:hypothetical protein
VLIYWFHLENAFQGLQVLGGYYNQGNREITTEFS